MALENRFTPQQDAGVESEVVGFDYGPILAAGEIILSATVTCAVEQGYDPSPSSRLSGASTVTASQRTGSMNGMVLARFSGQSAGTTYRLQCVVVTSLGNTLSIAAHI